MHSEPNCVFCKIVSGKMPASKIYEDEDVLGFMNHRPVHPGECLLIPKEHIDHFMDIDDELVVKIMRLGQRLSRSIREKLKPQRVGYVVAGYGVSHAHLIVIPNYHEHDITCEHFAVLKEGNIAFTDEHIPIAPREELDQMATALKL